MTTEASGDVGTPVVDLERLRRDLPALTEAFRTAEPYAHIVLEDFLAPGVIEKAIEEFPPLDPGQWNSYLHTNERKFSQTDPETWGPTLQAILAKLNSPEFVAFVGELLGAEDLIPDPSLEGGGLHQSTTGGFLNIHADFTVHPRNRKWQRRANILLYLNEDWKPEYGGDLELWSADMRRCVKKVSPIANRVLIFETGPTSYHGHPEPMPCPPGTARRSLALYYFTEEENPLVRSTDYRARPDDGMHAVAIFADKQILRAFDWTKRHLGVSDQTASKLNDYRDRIFHRKPQQ